MVEAVDGNVADGVELLEVELAKGREQFSRDAAGRGQKSAMTASSLMGFHMVCPGWSNPIVPGGPWE